MSKVISFLISNARVKEVVDAGRNKVILNIYYTGEDFGKDIVFAMGDERETGEVFLEEFHLNYTGNEEEEV